MRRLMACLTLAAAAFWGAAAPADEPDAPETPVAEQPETPPATDESEESDGKTRPVAVFGEATAWFTQPVGSDYVYATELDPSSAVSTQTRNQTFGTKNRLRWRAGAVIKGDVGAFIMTYWSAAVAEPFSFLTPGAFVIGETLTHPQFAGLNNDGLADGVTGSSRTATRDLRLDFLRDAFRIGRMSARWLAGIRFIDHAESIVADYHALVPNLPPLIDSAGNPATLQPKSDRAERSSQFSGRGIETGFEATYEVLPKLHLEGSFIYALMRGKSRAGFASTTHAYVAERSVEEGPVLVFPSAYDCVFSNPSGARCDVFEPLPGEDPTSPDYRDYSGYGDLSQREFVVGLVDRGSTNSAAVLEANLGFRWRAWRTLEVLGGIRQTRYQDAVLELRPRDPVLSLDGSVSLQVVDKEYRSVGYEGYYLGLAYTY